jgi:PAS domain S-box-containing protein
VRSSLFTRLMASYLGMGLAALLLVGLLSSFFFRTYFYETREAELIKKGDKIAHVMSDLLSSGISPMDTQHLSLLLDTLINARVIITDTQGRIIASSMNPMNHWNGQVDLEEIAESLQGEIKVNREYDQKYNAKMFNITIPIFTNNVITGVVIIHAPYETINQTILRVMGQFLIASMLAIGLTSILGYVMSKRVSRPLQEMNRIARSMAKGDFHVRAEVPYDDEVGQLADSINHLAGELDQTINELVNEKSKFEAVFRSMAEGVLVIDRKEAVLLANAQMERILGRREKQIVERPIKEILDEKSVIDLFKQVLISKKSSWTEVEWDRKAFLIYISPIHGGEEEMAGAVGVFQDISERRELERMKEKFVEDVSHELRSPLTLIRGNLEAILEGVAEGETKERYLQIIHRETLRLNRLVSELLDFSELRKKKDDLMGAVHLEELVEKIITKLEPWVSQKQIRITESIPRSFWVHGNQDRLEQVLTNLVENAVRYTPTGGEIFIKAQQERDMIRISVQDTGIGIPQDDLHVVWERFHKVDQARTRSEGGTGLGLAIVKEIVELHGGTVDVTSQEGIGSTFSFTLQKADPSQ